MCVRVCESLLDVRVLLCVCVRPYSERQAIISQRREEVRVAEERAKNEPRGQGSVSGMDVWEGRELLQRQQGQTPTGFIPFYSE